MGPRTPHARSSKPPPSKRGRAEGKNHRRPRSGNSSKTVERAAADVALSTSERLQKVLSRLGVSSRRQAETLIAEGRVRVNGEVPAADGMLVNVWKDRIAVDGRIVEANQRPVWLLFHKPRGYVSTLDGRRGIARFLADSSSGRKTPADASSVDGAAGAQRNRQGLVPVGKIEEDASGLMLLTNETGAVPELSMPSNRHVQIWHVDCLGMISKQQMGLLNGGVQLDDDAGGVVRADVITIGSGRMEINAKEKGWVTRLEVRLRDSRHRIVRRMCEKVGLKVARLSRRSFGPILLGSLRQGEHRRLTPNESKALKRGVSEKNKNAAR